LGPNEELNFVELKPLKTFIQDWRHLPGSDAIDCWGSREQALPQSRWIGVVHEDGVLFSPLDSELEFFVGLMEAAQ
jgi:hypothetical protein